MIKTIVEGGLGLMTEADREKKLSAVITGNVIDCKALVALAEECEELIQKETGRSLGPADYKKEIANMDPEELVEWITNVLPGEDETVPTEE